LKWEGREVLDHLATVFIDAVDIVLKEVASPDTLIKEDKAAEESSDNPLGLFGICRNVSIQYAIFIYYDKFGNII